MALTEQYLEEDIHPIDIVENLAAYHDLLTLCVL